VNELVEAKKDKSRKGTILTPVLVVWVVLSITIHGGLDEHCSQQRFSKQTNVPTLCQESNRSYGEKKGNRDL
jgi:hypothetical protein